MNCVALASFTDDLSIIIGILFSRLSDLMTGKELKKKKIDDPDPPAHARARFLRVGVAR